MWLVMNEHFEQKKKTTSKWKMEKNSFKNILTLNTSLKSSYQKIKKKGKHAQSKQLHRNLKTSLILHRYYLQLHVQLRKCLGKYEKQP